MTSAWGMFRILVAGEERRLHDLRATGLTVELGDLAPGDRVVRVGLGFGPEFWQVAPDYTIDPSRCAMRGGLLVVEDGRKVIDACNFGFLERNVEDVFYRS
jgi:hypothetical protein